MYGPRTRPGTWPGQVVFYVYGTKARPSAASPVPLRRRRRRGRRPEIWCEGHEGRTDATSRPLGPTHNWTRARLRDRCDSGRGRRRSTASGTECYRCESADIQFCDRSTPCPRGRSVSLRDDMCLHDCFVLVVTSLFGVTDCVQVELLFAIRVLRVFLSESSLSWTSFLRGRVIQCLGRLPFCRTLSGRWPLRDH